MSLAFRQLVSAVAGAEIVQPGARAITGVAFDSRAVSQGDCFVCRRGLRADGHAFVAQALAAGAAAVAAERPVQVPEGVGLALVPDGRRALAALARRFWGEPDSELGLVGVTGTDGKTTTARLIAWMLGAYGVTAGEMTTVGVSIGRQELGKSGRLTTPEAPVIAATLRRMAGADVGWAVLEVASHALELARVDGLAFDRAVITNVTHEHLDLHGDLAGYRRAKRRILELLDAAEPSPYGRAAVLNADDPVVAGMSGHTASEVVWFGASARADVRVERYDIDGGALLIEGASPWGAWSARTALLGSWNAANVAAAVACVGTITGDPGPGADALREFPPVRGRMEPVDCGQPFRVIVDFAHTPHALEACLRELRAGTDGRLIVVFGSAGEQDPAKRPMLGRVAARLADHAVIADEDPRGEEPEAIAAAVVGGARESGRDTPFDIVLDRRLAIRHAIGLARRGDTLVLAGKGHELTIEYADRQEPWDERQVAIEELAAIGFGA